MLGIAASALALLAGCGSSSKTTSTQSTSAAAATTTTSTAASSGGYGHSAATTSASGAASVVVVSKHGKPGTILAAGPKKLTVYLFEADKGTASACSGACASVWPPVTTSGSATASGAAQSADLGTITRPDGTKQVTYKGHPLYYYAGDSKPGDINGQNLSQFGAPWYVLNGSGMAVTSH
jgi:predicted lipoprotein with Yx(FWY)xxD motif